MKKASSLVLCILLLVSSLVGCGGGAADTPSSAPTPSPTPTPASGQEIVIYMEDDFIRDSYTDFYKAYEEATGNTVKPILVPKDQYVQNLTTAINGGQQIDVLYMNGQDVRSMAERGVLTDMTDLVGYWDRFYTNAVDQFTFGGVRYAVPTNAGNTSGVYLNNDVLTKYGLEAPETYDDLLAMRDVLQADGVSVFSFGGASKYMWPMWYFCTFGQTSGGKAVERTEQILRGEAKFTDDDCVEAMALLGQFGADGLFQDGVNGAEQAQGNAVFSSGNAALFFGGTWEVNGFREAGLTDDKLGVAPFPILKDGASSHQTGSAAGAAMSLYSGIDPARREAALALIDYLSSDEKVQELSKLDNTAMAPNKNYTAEGADPLYTETINPILGPTTDAFLDWIWPPEIVTAFQDQIQAVVGGQISAADAMVQIQEAFDALVADGYTFN